MIDASSPLILYAGGFTSFPMNRVFKSVDAGVSWSAATTGYIATSGATLASDPSTGGVVYGVSSDYVHKTVNFAASWAVANTGLVPFFMRSIVVDPATPTHVLAGSNDKKVWESTNAAGTWADASAGMQHDAVLSLSIDAGAPARAYAGTPSGGVYTKSFDTCGNGALDPGEDCDDGNNVNGDCCSATCDFEVGSCDDGIFCNGADGCSAGACSIHPGDPCTGGGECADTCDEGLDTCNEPAATPCTADGNACTDDVCDGLGACGVPNVAPCDDGDPCTNGDACAGGTCAGDPEPVPPGTCRVPTQPRKAQLQLKDKTPDTGDGFQWKWGKGGATAAGDFGNPVTTHAYTVCVYDESGPTDSLITSATIPAGGTCGTTACWKGLGNPAGTSGYKYKDSAGTAGGITGILLKPGVAGKAKAQVKGKGVNLVMPGENAHPALPLTAPVEARVQLHGNGECWEAGYSAAGVAKNSAQQLNLKSD